MEHNFCTHCGTASAGQISCPNCGMRSGVYNTGRDLSKRPHIPDYLIWSIITVLYGGVFGIIALVFTILCRNDLNAGRYDSARENSNVAFWCNAIPLGILVFVLVCLLLIGMLAALSSVR